MIKHQLTIYVKETDMSGDLPLHEVLVRRLLHLDISGATVMVGVMGYGKHGRVHRKRLFGVSDDRPLVINAIDDEPRLRAALPELRALAPGALMVLQEVEVL
jgi:PII-like signaling protein